VRRAIAFDRNTQLRASCCRPGRGPSFLLPPSRPSRRRRRASGR